MAENEDNEKVTAQKGKLFKVVLRSHFGSTNIGWCLTHLPTGIALLAEDVIQSGPQSGAPVQQVFSFTVLEATNRHNGLTLEFRLIRHIATIGENEQLKKVTIPVNIVDHKENFIVKSDFVEYSENSATVPVTGNDDDCTQVLKYGYPPYMKYGYAPTAGAAPCQPIAGSVKTAIPPYGYPDPAVAYGIIAIDYGYPSLGKYGYPVSFAKYGYYAAEGAKANCAVVQDDCGCQVEKYGYPVSFAKYGYYVAEGAKAGCPVVQDDCGCQVEKYGFPPPVKYGYAGGQS